MPMMAGAPVYGMPVQQMQPMTWQQPQPRYQAAPQQQARPAPQYAAAPRQPAQAALPKPKVRAVSADPTPPAPPQRLALPSPEELGLRPAASPVSPAAVVAAVDWNQVHDRLDRLGVVNFQRDRLPQGGFRVVFTLPAGATPAQQVEATGTTEADATLQALQRAEAVNVARR